jgi:predicted nucleic acid-binding Zn ribbon protein
MTRTKIPSSELVLLEEVENESLKTTLSMKECVSQFSETAVGNSVVVVSSIHALWEDIVGLDVSKHVSVRNVKSGVLNVVADHPAWKTQLKYMEQNIISQINEKIKGDRIESIHMSVARK